MAIEVDYNGFTFTFPDGTSDNEVYSFLEQNADSMASDYVEPAPQEAPPPRPFYEMAPGDNTQPSSAFTDPTLDLSGQTVETQEDVTQYVDGYTVDGKIDPRSTRWKGMSSNEIIEARNQDVRDGVIGGHVMRDGPAYDANAQVANVSRDKGIEDRQVELETTHPELSKQELFEKANSDQTIDGVKNVGQAALMLTPAGHGIRGMAAMGALTGAGDEALEVIADSAKGNRDLLDTDNALDIIESGLYGGTIGGVFGSVFKGIEKLIDFAKGGNKVTNEVAELAAEYGIKLTPGQKVDSKTLKHLEDITADGVGGGSITRTREDQVVKAQKIAEKEATLAKESLVDDFYKKDPEVKLLKKGREDINTPVEELDAIDNRLGTIWNDAVKKVDEDGVILNAVPNALKERRGALSKAYEDSLKKLDDDIIMTHGQQIETPIPRTNKMMGDIVTEEKRLGTLSKGVEKPVSGLSKFAPKSFSDMDLMKRSLNDKANTMFNKGEHGASKKFSGLSKAVKGDMDDLARQFGNNTSEYKAADRNWSDFAEMSDSSLIKSLKRKEFGEDVWKTLSSGAAKDSKVEKFVKVINDSTEATTVKKAMTVKFSEDAVAAGNKSGDFVVGDYVKFLKNNNNALKHFNKEVFNKNRGLIKLMDVIAKGEKATQAAANQGPWAGVLSKLAPSLVLGGIGGVSAGWETGLAGAVSGFGGRAAMAKVLLPAISKSPEKLAQALEKPTIKKLLIQLAKVTGESAKKLEDKLIKALIIELDVEA